MTSIADVEKALLEIGNYKSAKEWLHDDFAKKKLARSYDDWIKDIDDHHLYLTLREHIETCLDEPEYIGYKDNPTE